MNYFILPNNRFIAAIHKNAHNALAAAIVQTFYKELMECVNTALPESKRFADLHIWRALAPQTEIPRARVYALLREPVDRFLSAMAMMPHLNIDETLATLAEQIQPPFFRQSDYMLTGAKLYRFPDQIELLSQDVGLPYPLPVINQGRNPKPVLTDAQKKAVEKYYAEDGELYHRIPNREELS